MINIVCAFGAEAQPIVKGLGLQMVDSNLPFPLYQNKETRLIVCGMGNDNAFESTRRLIASQHTLCGGKWLNFGVAGSAQWPIGTFVFAKSVCTRNQPEPWLLDHRSPPDFTTACICNVDTVEKRYDVPHVYEMESLGYLNALKHYQLDRQALILKLITDGPSDHDGLRVPAIKTVLRKFAIELVNIVKTI